MISLSRRISNVKSSPTVQLNAKAKALGKQGIKVLNFAVGEPDFNTPAPIVDTAIASLKAGRTKYGPAGGSPEFLEAIAAKLKRENGLDFQSNEIVAGIGAKEILFHIFLATLNDGDEVLVPSPYWVSYPDQIIAAGAKPVILPLADDIAKTPLSIKDLAAKATSQTKAIVLNSPNNPAGYMYSRAFLEELGAYLKDKQWWIISDEIYEYLSFDHPHVSLLSLFPELRDRFILVNGLSKGFAMTGWRVGYCAGPAPVMKLVRDLQSHSSTCIPPFIEDASIFALSKGNSLLKAEIEVLKKRRDLAVAQLKSMPELSYVAPHGAFYIFIDIRDALKKAKKPTTGFELSEQLLLEHHVAVVPGDAFGAPGYLRLSYACDEATIKEGLIRIGRAVSSL